MSAFQVSRLNGCACDQESIYTLWFPFSYAKTMDLAIDYVLEQRKEHPTGSLTAQDLFYVKVTRVQDIFKVFGELVETQVKSGHSNAMINGILEVNTILLVS